MLSENALSKKVNMKFAIIIKSKKPVAIYNEIEKYINYLINTGIDIVIEESMAQAINTRIPTFKNRIPPGTDNIVVFGGDGTFLLAIRLMGAQDIPIIGVNIGSLGFLTEITMNELYRATELVMSGRAEYEKRMRLSARVVEQDKEVMSYYVLNDAVITKSTIARIVSLKINVDNRYVTKYRADGLIISTPTGSTAYSMAAGGPIVYPTMDSIIITPIAPHTLTNRPIILSADSIVEIELDTDDTDVVVTLDGQVSGAFKKSHKLVIKKSAHYVTLIKSQYRSYFDILREKLKWGER